MPLSPAPKPAPDLGAALQQAVTALQSIVAGKPENDQLIRELLQLCGQSLQAGGGGTWVTDPPERPELVHEHNLAGLQLIANGTPTRGVIAGVRRCAREAKPLIVPPFFTEQNANTAGGVDMPENPSPFELLFIPVRVHGKVGLVMVIAVPPGDAQDANRHRTFLNFLMRMASIVEPALAERHVNLIEHDRGTSNKLVRFADQIHKHLFPNQVAADICNLARDVLSAERVTVELYPRLKQKVVAVSNVEEPNKRANVMQVLRLLFDYVRDRHVPVVLDREAAKQLVSDPTLQDAATAYFMACEFDAILLAPIKADDPAAPVLGVVLAEYKSSQTAQANTSLVAEVARLSTGSVSNAIDVDSVPLISYFYAVRDLWRKPTSDRRTAIVGIAGILLVALTFICAIPFDFAIKADCQIRPSAQLSIVAPVEERIVEIPVRAGEHVYPREKKATLGDAVRPLAVFDSTDLVQKKAEATGRLGQLQVEMKDYETKRDQAKIAGVQKEIEQVQTQIDLLDHQIDQCTVWSPIEGTVLTENVEQKRWSTPKKSEPLMEVASFSDWELVVDVPESEVAGVRITLDRATRAAVVDGRTDAGIEVEYILYPWPDTCYSIRAKGTATLLPASQQVKNSNVFRLQVKLDPKSLPPGIAMSGVTGRAKLHIGRKPLAAQWLRGAVRLLKMTILF
jgi:hypothetical protein